MALATIMIIDDEEELRENLRDLLEFKGYDVVMFATAEDALSQIESINIDLCLLDIQLPGMDGIEALQRIKQIRPTLPTVIVSASSVRGILDQAEEYGADRIILKPYSQQEMLQIVEELTGARSKE